MVSLDRASHRSADPCTRAWVEGRAPRIDASIATAILGGVDRGPARPSRPWRKRSRLLRHALLSGDEPSAAEKGREFVLHRPESECFAGMLYRVGHQPSDKTHARDSEVDP